MTVNPIYSHQGDSHAVLHSSCLCQHRPRGQCEEPDSIDFDCVCFDISYGSLSYAEAGDTPASRVGHFGAEKYSSHLSFNTRDAVAELFSGDYFHPSGRHQDTRCDVSFHSDRHTIFYRSNVVHKSLSDREAVFDPVATAAPDLYDEEPRDRTAR